MRHATRLHRSGVLLLDETGLLDGKDGRRKKVRGVFFFFYPLKHKFRRRVVTFPGLAIMITILGATYWATVSEYFRSSSEVAMLSSTQIGKE